MEGQSCSSFSEIFSEQIRPQLVSGGEGCLLQTEREDNFQGWLRSQYGGCPCYVSIRDDVSMMAFPPYSFSVQSDIVLKQLALIKQSPKDQPSDPDFPFFLSIFILLFGLLIVFSNLSDSQASIF